MAESTYAISIYEPATGLSYHENSQATLETMSGIKSVIGTLALEQAATHGHDIDTYTMKVTADHDSNGSGELRHVLQMDTDPLVLSMRELAMLSITDSDCVATNALIDYLGDRDNVNAAIRKTFGLPSMHLVTDRITFPGVDHHTQPFQVGSATMDDFVAYYAQLWSPQSKWNPRSSEHGWYQDQHRKVENARLFGMEQVELPVTIDWAHKTGSAEDEAGSGFYKTYMDAGMLRTEGRELFIAAAETTHVPIGVMNAELIEQEFAARNRLILESLGVELEEDLSSVA